MEPATGNSVQRSQRHEPRAACFRELRPTHSLIHEHRRRGAGVRGGVGDGAGEGIIRSLGDNDGDGIHGIGVLDLRAWRSGLDLAHGVGIDAGSGEDDGPEGDIAVLMLTYFYTKNR